MPIDKVSKPNRWIGPSNSEQYLAVKSALPQVSTLMSKEVSEYRKQSIAGEIEQGLFREGSGSNVQENNDYASTYNGRAVAGFSKMAQAVGGSGGGFRGGFGDTAMQVPEVYSPLWLNSNLSLPRDRATINAWCRSFYALNPFVHNAISLHSTYPISKLSIKCPNKDIEKFFNDMIEEIDLMNICVQIAQEYWLLGEAFPYAELDEGKGKWSRLMIQNPDYIIVKRTVVADEPMIMLRPDENLKKIIMSNRPADIEQRKQLNPHIIDSVKRGQNIPLDNFHVSHLARRISPYEIRGTGLPTCIFRQLALFDSLRECYSSDTEVLTDQGFKTIGELVRYSTNIAQNPNYVNGVELDENEQITSVLTMKEDFTVACVNPETNEIEYHKPSELHMSQYSGKMLHFIGDKVDCLVSPNHKMWVKEQTNGRWGGYQKRPASNLLDKKKYYRLTSNARYVSGKDIPSVDVCGHDIPIKLYLEVLGYIVSEGCVYENFENGRYDALIDVSQFTESPFYGSMKTALEAFADKLNRNVSHQLKMSSWNMPQPKECWHGRISGKDLSVFFKNEIGVDGSTYSADKHLPRWVMDLKPELLRILLDAMVAGDGSQNKSQYGTGSVSWRYSTISKQLADDVYEIAYKLGYVPNICVSERYINDRHVREYIVLWSNTHYGTEPLIYTGTRTPRDKGGFGASICEENYTGVVWCFEVPTGLFITRRNGKITIQGNSKYAQASEMINPTTIVKIGTDDASGLHPTFADLEAWRDVFEQSANNKNFKIFTHAGVNVERIGWGQGIYDISPDITQLIKEILMGLQVPPVIMGDAADTPYASAGVALDVLRQRYMQFRNMLSAWLRRKIFAPISKIQGFYDYQGGEKQLIVPEVDWNHMSLFDTGDFINMLLTLTQGTGDQKRVSIHTLYRSMGLDWEDEQRKIRKETIQAAIFKKEADALVKMDLNSLRSLDEEDEIPEPKEGVASEAPLEAPLPGETPPGTLPGLDLGAMPPPPSSPEAPPPPTAPSAPPAPVP
jgi:hypothetical protein